VGVNGLGSLAGRQMSSSPSARESLDKKHVRVSQLVSQSPRNPQTHAPKKKNRHHKKSRRIPHAESNRKLFGRWQRL